LKMGALTTGATASSFFVLPNILMYNRKAEDVKREESSRLEPNPKVWGWRGKLYGKSMVFGSGLS